MAPAIIAIKTIKIIAHNIDKAKYYFTANISTILFDGYMIVYNSKKPELEPELDADSSSDENISLPKLGSNMLYESIIAQQEFDTPNTRYNEASLVNKLDPSNLNIGRPSTYASIISKILERSYVKVEKNIAGRITEALSYKLKPNMPLEKVISKITLGQETNKFVPTFLGNQVTNFLEKNFTKLMDYNFTANLEESLDDIAEGKINWLAILKPFYIDLHNQINAVQASNIEPASLGKYIGEQPITQYKIYANVSKYGEILKLVPDKGKTIIAPIKPPYNLETITLEEACAIFKYPKNLGKYNRKMVILKKGQYGFYITWGKDNISLAEKPNLNLNLNLNLDRDSSSAIQPDNITLENAIKYIEAKQKTNIFEETDKTTNIKYTILNGPYGLYIKLVYPNKKTANVKLPPNIDIKTVSLDIIKEQLSKPKKRVYKKKLVMT